MGQRSDSTVDKSFNNTNNYDVHSSLLGPKTLFNTNKMKSKCCETLKKVICTTKYHPKISIYINICCGPIVKKNVVGNAQIPLL